MVLVKIISLLFLELASLLCVFWSFKLHKNLFSKTVSSESNKSISFSGHDLLEHDGSGILSAGVCPLGKWGAWFIFVWSIVLLSILFSVYRKPSTDFNSTCKTLGIMNAVFIGIIFILSLIMNLPLFIRTLPFFFIQTSVTISLMTSVS